MLKLLQDVKSLEEAKSSFRMLIAWKKPRAAEGKSIVMRCGCCRVTICYHVKYHGSPRAGKTRNQARVPVDLNHDLQWQILVKMVSL
jgi:hypothetical protein